MKFLKGESLTLECETKAQGDKIDESLDNIILPKNGFRIENGVLNEKKGRTLLTFSCNYKHWFYHAEPSDHVNYVGVANKRGSGWEPLIISILTEHVVERYRIIIWSRLVRIIRVVIFLTE
jgi:hypothetical protein